MEQRILNYWSGYLQIRITGHSYDRFLNLCAFHGIRLWNLLPSGEVYTACISRKDFKKLRQIVRKSHTSVRIIQKQGFPFFLHKYRKRKMYMIGLAAAMAVMFWLSSHVWHISIEGNRSQTDDVMFEYLMSEGIRQGMPKKLVDCAELASDIRNYFTQFSWVTAELKGTRLVIHVKEGIPEKETESERSKEGFQTPTDLVAAAEGTVLSVYVRKGTALIKPGDMTEPGTLLVAGLIPIRDDSGAIVSWQQVRADADIVIRTQRLYSDTVSLKGTEKIYTGKIKTHYLIRIGAKSFSLPDPFDSLEQYELHSELMQFRLMENFYLPIYVQKFTAKEYENREILYTKEQASEILNANFQYFMKNLEEKGVQIFENDVKIEWNEKSAIAKGSIWTGESAYTRSEAGEITREELLKHEYG